LIKITVLLNYINDTLDNFKVEWLCIKYFKMNLKFGDVSFYLLRLFYLDNHVVICITKLPLCHPYVPAYWLVSDYQFVVTDHLNTTFALGQLKDEICHIFHIYNNRPKVL